MALAALLREAEAASPSHRIEWRDRLAAHGVKAIEGVRPWLTNPALAAFAIRVIEKAGANGELARATEVLRAARSTVPPTLKGDVEWALQQLKLKAQPEPEVAPPSPPSAARPVRRERPHMAPVARRHTRTSI